MEEMNMVNEMENVVKVIEECDPMENSGGNVLVKFVVGLGLTVIGVGGAIIYKNRDKLEARQIKKLEKKGYIVRKAEPVESTENDESEPVEETE